MSAVLDNSSFDMLRNLLQTCRNAFAKAPVTTDSEHRHLQLSLEIFPVASDGFQSSAVIIKASRQAEASDGCFDRHKLRNRFGICIGQRVGNAETLITRHDESFFNIQT